jgi:hypothetical protein
MDEAVLFQAALDEVLSVLPASSPLCIALDDTLVRKCGTHIEGVSWRRDPLGPAFQTTPASPATCPPPAPTSDASAKMPNSTTCLQSPRKKRSTDARRAMENPRPLPRNCAAMI